MIKEAHVGIGIRGAESNQAAAFANFSIVDFKDLRRLMFWHGRSQGYKEVYLFCVRMLVVWGYAIVHLLVNSVTSMSAV